MAKCIVGANESRPLPPALPKHRSLIGIMRSPSKNNNRRRSYPIGRHLFCPSCSQHGQFKASRCPRWNLGGANMLSRWPRYAHKKLNIAPGSAKIQPRWPRWSQDGANMAPRWSKTRQHEPKRRLTWPKRGQDGQGGANMERQGRAKMAELEPR